LLKMSFQWDRLERLSGRSHKIAQNGDVRAVGSDAPRVHGQTKAFRHVQIHTCIVQFREAETCCRLNAVKSRRIDRPRRAVTLPRAARQFVELLPIALVPRIHRLIQSVIPYLDASQGL
jgi:hypothetical protein